MKLKVYNRYNTFSDIKFDKNGFYVYYSDEKNNPIFYCYSAISNIYKIKKHIVNNKVDGVSSTIKYLTFTISFKDGSYIHITTDKISAIQNKLEKKFVFFDWIKRKCSLKELITQEIDNPNMNNFLTSDVDIVKDYKKLVYIKNKLIEKI